MKKSVTASAAAKKPAPWRLPGEIPAAAIGNRIRYGQELIRRTPAYLGPDSPDPEKRFAGNRLSCANCHLGAGQQPDAIGFVGISARFPQYRPRENSIQTLAQRINGCMERSLNGRALPEQSPEMRAMQAYMTWLSQGYAPQSKVHGQGLPELELPKRAADPAAGKILFAAKCASCHGPTGQGRRLNASKTSDGYLYPPLWGPDSFNDGAGMHRLITAARYIKANMPFGMPTLSRDQAFDVAAFINSQPRPHRPGLDQDYPDRSKKPVDAPFGPWNDGFSAQQHQYGPYPPMLKGKKPSGG